MVLYTVYLEVARARAQEWHTWMADEHVPEVLETGCFHNAWMCRVEEQDSPTHIAYRILYLAKSTEVFATYEAEHAPALKKDHTDRYGADVRARRDLVTVEHAF